MTKFDSRERRILINTCFGHFMSHFNMLVFPAIVLPLAARVNLDMATVLGFSFWMYLLFGFTALPWGLAADRWGAGALMVLFYAGAAWPGWQQRCGLIRRLGSPWPWPCWGFFPESTIRPGWD